VQLAELERVVETLGLDETLRADRFGVLARFADPGKEVDRVGVLETERVTHPCRRFEPGGELVEVDTYPLARLSLAMLSPRGDNSLDDWFGLRFWCEPWAQPRLDQRTRALVAVMVTPVPVAGVTATLPEPIVRVAGDVLATVRAVPAPLESAESVNRDRNHLRSRLLHYSGRQVVFGPDVRAAKTLPELRLFDDRTTYCIAATGPWL
jgi:hypothetical protein